MNLYEEVLSELQKEEKIKDIEKETIKNLLEEVVKSLESKKYFIALMLLIKIYGISQLKCIVNFIFQSYVIPNKEYFREVQKNNIKLLNKYKHYYGELLLEQKEFRFDIIWIDKQCLVLFDGNEFIKEDFLQEYKDTLKDDYIIITNELDYELIIKYDKEILVDMINGEKNPIYLYYDDNYFEIALRIFDFSQILKNERVVILYKKQYLKEFFLDSQAIFPDIIYGKDNSEINQLLRNIVFQREQITEKADREQKEYYNKNSDLIIDNIKKGIPKILFFTSLFTTALQYHAKNMEKSAKKLGYKTELLIEKSEIHKIFISTFIIKVNEFKPDIIFLLDHFRIENKPIENIVYITWIQDPLPNIMNKDVPLKLGDRDFILNHFISWNKFFELGYDRSHIIEGPIPANQDIYKKYNITKEEKQKYSCDICILCHTSPVKDYIENKIFYGNNETLNDKIKTVFYSYYSLIQNDFDMILYSTEEFELFIEEYFIQIYHLKLDKRVIKFYATCMHQELNNIIFRHCLVDCLIEAGYTNIKLWGNGWKDEEKYLPYAMGKAENGETLSKIYQCSKIVLGHNLMTTAAARAWESIFSETLYLCNWIPPESDVTDIRTILKPEEFVMFKGKEDLLSKVKYYLENEEERQRMITIEKESALKKMTFDATCKRMLDFLKEQL